MPDDLETYRAAHKAKKKDIYISKVSISSQGSGIKILHNYREFKMPTVTKYFDSVVQKYLATPMLLDNKKHDLRLYVVIVSVDPLIAYLNDEGLARFCTEDYAEPDPQNTKNDAIHLTNYAVNKGNDNFVLTEELNEIN